MMLHILRLIATLVIPALVSAHGFVQQVTIDGTVYHGNNLNVGTPAPSIIRLVSTYFPIKGITNPATNCGQDAQFASLVGNANPGSQIEVLWVGKFDGSTNWPHNTGPLMHYMAMCEGSCSTYNSTNAEWFKISELGLESDGRTWYQAALMSRAPANVTIPSTLAPGQYLLRSEIIALHLAMTEGGAEFYPACIQLNVGGNQTQGPASSEECTFPGCYSDTDPGILTPDIYNPPVEYTFPGPPIASFADTDSSIANANTSSSTTTPICQCMPRACSNSEDAVKRDSRSRRWLGHSN